MMKTITLSLAVAATLLTVGLRAQTRGVTAEDYFAFETLGDPRFSPDGSTIAYVVTTVDQKQNRRRSEIYAVPVDGSRPPRALTTAPQSSSSPRWSPDGQAIAFLSARPMPGDAATDTPRPQVWLLPLAGGEPRRVT
ncbi:MAG: PD40 domain-containing protein, partial [Acidobacteria bacterium]|nr:PD40 domain-containing protein [Acidobacteriota bacterium]